MFNSEQKYEFDDFKEIVERSNSAKSPFLSQLRCQLWQLDKGRNLSLKNNQYEIRLEDGMINRRILESIEEIEDVIANEFGLPKLPVREAIEILQDQGVDLFVKEEIKG